MGKHVKFEIKSTRIKPIKNPYKNSTNYVASADLI